MRVLYKNRLSESDVQAARLIIFAVGLLVVSTAYAVSYVRVLPRAGDGIFSLLHRYNLPRTEQYISKFKELNPNGFVNGGDLRRGIYYNLPIRVYEYDGNSIRSTLGISNYQHAKQLQLYNEDMLDKGLRAFHYFDDLQLWVPFYWRDHLLGSLENGTPESDETSDTVGRSQIFSIFGKQFQKVVQKDNTLEGTIFYLVAGHGGPDPGAIGLRGRYQLYEDEYSYDITLRLARRLIEHGGLVYVIVRDANDGIRDDAILPGSADEYYWGGARISSNTKQRLAKRASIINELYEKNRYRAKKQYAIILHLDSRPGPKRVDIYYYYQRQNREGRGLALSMYKTVQQKYDQHQPGRGYRSMVTTRDLYMLENTKPATVYIELGNIQNQRDQDRFVIANNRQAVANWLCLGILRYLE